MINSSRLIYYYILIKKQRNKCHDSLSESETRIIINHIEHTHKILSKRKKKSGLINMATEHGINGGILSETY